MKPYYCHIKDINISYLKTTNDLAENSANRLANEEIPMLFDYLEFERPY